MYNSFVNMIRRMVKALKLTFTWLGGGGITDGRLEFSASRTKLIEIISQKLREAEQRKKNINHYLP